MGAVAAPPRWEQVGLTEDEYRRVVELLGREPNDLELGLFGVMWSEHCSYKSSRVHLRRLPTDGERVLVGPGENAGVLDIGDGWAVAVRIESHNHPSAIEPYQGAATGVGGILRDIFTMGARPVALLDSLRFGPLAAARNRYLFAGVVKGIADYGNSVGVPTVGGEVYFEECYSENPLVNVMCVGVVRADRVVRGRAEGVGNPVYLVGARTGRDGIHGASLLASQEFRTGAEEMRPAVQVGDPFREKLLLEASLELVETGAAAGVNDLGAAGITSAAAETAARAGTGIEVDVALVPRREEGMTPYEVMLSESQERMLVIARRGREGEVEAVFRKWGLEATPIGRVTGDGLLRVLDGGRPVAEVPVRALTREAPLYRRPARRPEWLDELQAFDPASLPDLRPEEAGRALRALLASPSVSSKAWVYRQYDHMVRTCTVVTPGADAAVLRVRGARAGVALATDGNGRYCHLDPFLGAAIAAAEAARNVACAGARPVGLTNCLNFASPERPEVMWQFEQAIEGLRAACLALGVPVTGGNVSFYNETAGRGVYPTPVVGMVGLLADPARAVRSGFRAAGDAVVLLGGWAAGGAGGGDGAGALLDGDPLGLGGSEYLRVVHGVVAGRPPALDLRLEGALHRMLAEAAEAGLLRSAHDCSEGGLLVALAECAFAAEPGAGGAEVDVAALVPDGAGGAAAPAGAPALARLDALLFGEAQSRAVVTVERGRLAELEELAARHGVPCRALGTVGGDRLVIRRGRETLVDEPVAELREIWETALQRQLAGAGEGRRGG